MEDIKKMLSNATMAYTDMPIDVDGKAVVKSIFELLKENKKDIETANSIDVKNENGFSIDFNRITKMEAELGELEDNYRRVLHMNKNENNYLEGAETDNLGTICLAYDGNTYCLLEMVMKAILTHNSIIVTSEADYMKATNELIVILVKRILEAYRINKNLVQILYTSRIEELLENSISINKVVAVGNRDFQNRIKKISKVEVICKGYDNFDIYVEDLANLQFIEKIVASGDNIDVYVRSGLEVPFEDYIEVADIDEAIAQINYSTSGYSSSIFTENKENASEFLRRVKADNISVNSSPLVEKMVGVDIDLLITKKNMVYPNPLAEGTEESKVEFPTTRAILEENKAKADKENTEKIAKMQDENAKLKESSEQLQKQAQTQLDKKDKEVNELKRQLEESRSLTNKYMDAFRKSFFSRMFGKVSKDELEKDTRMLS